MSRGLYRKLIAVLEMLLVSSRHYPSIGLRTAIRYG